MKVTPTNILRLWFSADTPLRQYRIKMNPELWAACERVSQKFVSPSGALELNQYRKSDQIAFARAVQQELLQANPVRIKPHSIPQRQVS